MGIYLFNREALLDLLNAQPLATDFGKEIFPRSIQTHRVQAHLFDGYWEDLGTVKAYHEANLALASDNPPFDFHSPEGVIYTRMRYLPASRISGATLEQCLVSDGCVIAAGTQHRALRRRRAQPHRPQRARCATPSSSAPTASRPTPNAARTASAACPTSASATAASSSGPSSTRTAASAATSRSSTARESRTTKGENYVIRDGIVVIPRGSVVPDGTVI